MAEYAKRTCYGCGIRLQQPQMFTMLIERSGVRDDPLPARSEWICPDCLPSMRQRNPFHRERAEREAKRERVEREPKMPVEIPRKELTKEEAGKLRWAEEQERRRLANALKRNSDGSHD